MAEYIHLIGTEQVQSAANVMREAAHEMHRSANTISEALRHHSEMMRELVDTLVRMEDRRKNDV